MFNLNGHIAVVTGASSGIGASLAEALATAGARVILIARREVQLHAQAETIRSRGGEALVLAADLLRREAIPDLASRCAEGFGPVSILVNAAGMNPRLPACELSLEDWDATLNLNLTAPFLLARELVPAMRTQGWGRIINIASLQSLRAFADGLAYGASKAGVVQLTRAMAEAWSKHGICCNAIAPGFFPTELTAAVFADEQRRRQVAAQTAVGRNGQLQDLHGPVVFLASRAADYVTGQTLFVDGGFSAK